MKTNRNTITRIATAAAMIASAVTAHAANRTLILLQENSSGTSYMTDILPAGPVRAAADAIIDSFVENGETAKFQALAAGSYQRFVNLSDNNCNRANLLNQLIQQSKDGFTVDLAILGHGGPEALNLHNNEQLTGRTVRLGTSPTGQPLTLVDNGTIRSLLVDAKAREGAGFNFNLRLVHMCNCFGGTTNDDWLAIGAKTSIGAPLMDWMPEPMNTFFWNDFVKNDKRASQSAADSLAATRIIWTPVPTYSDIQENGLTKIQETRQSVLGNTNLIFKDEYQLAVNQSRTINVRANQTHNFPLVYMVAGQTYSFSAGSTDTWVNGFAPFSTTANANGYTPGPLDFARRNPGNMMRLIGERFTHTNALSFIGGSGFSIGTSRTITAPGHGFLNLYANDVITSYADNSGSINVTVRRTR